MQLQLFAELIIILWIRDEKGGDYVQKWFGMAQF
jgi:hypothetical protein